MATYVAFTAAATTPTLPAGTAIGDWVIVFAGRDANATPPTLPAGWTQIITRASANAILVAYRLRDSAWTMPSFVNATRATAVTVRPASGKILKVGVNAVQGATSTSVAWAVQTLQVNDGTSVILRYFAHTRPDATPGTPANHTIIEATGTRPGFGTYRKTTTTDMAAATLTVSRSDVWSSAQVEIRDAVAPNVGTATVNHTWNASASGTAPLVAAVTQAAYRFYDDAGTESGAAPLAAQDTPVIGNLTNGDGYGALRIRLQSTNARDLLGTDDWSLRWEKNASGTWNNVLGTVVSEYTEANFATSLTIADGNIHGQSFKGTGTELTVAGFYISELGNAAGSLTAVLYAHTGAFGNGGTGTGTVIATSTTVKTTTDFSDGAFSWHYFNFPAGVVLTNNVNYVIGLRYNGFADGSNAFRLALDDTSPTHAGNRSIFAASWTGFSTADLVFQVYSANTVIPYDNPNLTGLAATTNRLTGGSGTFFPGKISEAALAANIGWTGNNYTEVLYSLKILAANVAGDDVLRFRVYRNGASTGMTYDVTPTITIVRPQQGTADVFHDWTSTATGAMPVSEPPNEGSADVAWSADVTASGTAPGIFPFPGTGLVGWWDADDPTSFTLTPGSTVLEWKDKSGLDRHFGQATLALRPTRTGTLNGRTAVTFDGVDDYMDTAAFTVPQPITVFLMMDLSTDGSQGFLSSVGGSFQAYVGTSTVFFYCGTTPSGLGAGSVFGGPHHWRFTANGASTTVHADGVQRAIGDTGTAGTTTGFRIAERNLTAGYRLSGKMCEIVVYDRVLTAPEIVEVESYLIAKWLTVIPPKTGSATASWTETITATGVKPVVPVKTGSAVATWAETITTTGKRTPRATSTASHLWTPAAQGVKPVVGMKQGTAVVNWKASFGTIRDSFDGPAGTLLTSLGYTKMGNTSSHLLDGLGNALTDVSVNQGWSANGSTTPIGSNSWGELTFSLPTKPGPEYWIELRFCSTSATALDATAASYGAAVVYNYPTPPALMLYRHPTYSLKAEVPFTGDHNRDYVLRAEWNNGVIKLKLDGVEVLTWTDPSPILGAYVAFYTDYGYGGVSDVLRSLNAGTSTAVGFSPTIVLPNQGSATASWTEALTAQGKKAPKATASATWTEALTAQGKKAPKATASATWTEALTAQGKKSPRATSTTSYLETISVTSKRNPRATSTANHSWTSIAQGVKPVVGVKQGSAIASWATTGTATGKRTPKATVTAQYTENVTATGSKTQRGTAIVSWSEAISAQGKKTPVSTGTTSYLETITAAGKKTPKAVSTANHSWTSIAQGFRPVVGQKQGSAIAVWSETITATGKRAPIATSTTLYSENVTAAGKKLQKSTVTTTWTNAIIAQGKKLQKATSTTAYLFTGSAVGKKTSKAVTTANHSWVSIAQGIKPVVGQKQGTAIVSWAETSTGVGKRFPKATATVSYFETVTVNGKKFLRGTATVAWTETISATGKKVLRGSSTVLWSESITVSGKRIPKAFGAVFHSWDLLVDGKYYPKAMSTVEILWQLSATGVDERGIVILNDADSIFLGNLEVKAVYVGSNKVWEML